MLTDRVVSYLIDWVATDLPEKQEDIKKLLFPLIEKLPPSEEIQSRISSLYRGEFVRDVHNILTQRKPDSLLSYAKLNILLQNKELSKKQLSLLVEQPLLIEHLSANALMDIAYSLLNDAPMHAFRLLKETIVKIKNSTELNHAKTMYRELKPVMPERSFAHTKIALAGNCTLTPLADYLHVGMLYYDIEGEIWEAPFNQWITQSLNAGSELYKFAPSFIIFYLSSLGLTCSGTKIPVDASDTIEPLKNCIAHLTKNLSSRIILILPEPLEEEYDSSSMFCSWRRHFIEKLYHCFEGNVIFLDTQMLVAEIGEKKWFAPRFWYHAKLPCQENSLIGGNPARRNGEKFFDNG